MTKGNVCGTVDRVGGETLNIGPTKNDPKAGQSPVFITKRGNQLLAEVAPEHHAMLKQAMTDSLSEMQMLFSTADRLEGAIE